MAIGGRRLRTIFGALVKPRHYVAAWNMLRVYTRPLDAYRRYLFARGDYPIDLLIRTPLGCRSIRLFSHHDMLTVNEVFCRGDYHTGMTDEIVVDIGSNIGISALYFLTRHSRSRAFLFEPVPINVDRLQRNLSGFENRYTLSKVAVGLSNGHVDFGVEPTGRYGGIHRRTGTTISVDCIDINDVLRPVLERHHRIDLLKIDVEGLELPLAEHVAPDIRSLIRTALLECTVPANPWPATHDLRQCGPIARLIRRSDVKPQAR
ncbi:MAG TPA: FkbM family methyltransferase [Phycisphaerales bacterium]|nr:FkbM family methyltransferase [Phycisphaerales bacterium]HRQ75495.1 FkbM family methyltransferase [Phycisphaerales bacterium]